MTNRTRKIILLAFALAFALAAPAVVFYTSGYRYNWKKGRVDLTGIIKFDSRPAGAEIVVNGARHKKTTPVSLFRLLPQEYDIRLEKPGYFPWKKTLEVRSGETTFTRMVALIRQGIPKLVFGSDIVADAFSRDGGQAAVLRRVDSWLELMVRQKDDDYRLVARFGEDKYDEPRLEWSPDGRLLLLTARDGGKELHLFVHAPGQDSGLRSLHDNLPADDRLVTRWSTDGSKIVVVTAHRAIVVDPVDASSESKSISSRIMDAASDGRSLFVLRSAIGGAALERTEIGTPTPPEKLIDLPPGDYGIVLLEGRDMLIRDARSDKSLLLDLDTLVSSEVMDADRASWETAGGQGRLLLWNDFEMGVYDPRTGKSSLVTRLGIPLGKCAWHPSGDLILYSTDAGIKAIELDDRGERNTYELAPLAATGDFVVSIDGLTLTLTGTAGNQRGVYERDL